MDAVQEWLSKPKADFRRIVAEVVKEPELIVNLLDGTRSSSARVRLGSAKAVWLLSQKRPDLLYPYFDAILDLIDNENAILRWNAIRTLGSLAAADHEDKIEGLIDKYLDLIVGHRMIDAGNAIAGAAAIAVAKPHLAARIAAGILTVRHARYQTAECRNVAIGHAIQALDRFFHLLANQDAVLRFVRAQTANTRTATRRKAERFLKKWGSSDTLLKLKK